MMFVEDQYVGGKIILAIIINLCQFWVAEHLLVGKSLCIFFFSRVSHSMQTT